MARLAEPDVIGLSSARARTACRMRCSTCCAGYRVGHEVWLELGLQSAFDATLDRVNRGHGFGEYRQASTQRGRAAWKVCTHLIVGLPGEDSTARTTAWHAYSITGWSTA